MSILDGAKYKLIASVKKYLLVQQKKSRPKVPSQVFEKSSIIDLVYLSQAHLAHSTVILYKSENTKDLQEGIRC